MTTLEIGPGRVAFRVVFPDAAGDLAGQLAGYRITHPAFGEDGANLCGGENGHWIPVGEGHWTQESVEPLTLAPSLRCTMCGDHGFVRDGKWVPA